jgi:hypothetical protein
LEVGLVLIVLEESEAENLKDIVDSWIDGFEIATDQVITDKTFTQPEDMLSAADGIRHMYDDAVKIRQKLWRAIKAEAPNAAIFMPPWKDGNDS